jgi:hypothetical protein
MPLVLNTWALTCSSATGYVARLLSCAGTKLPGGA